MSTREDREEDARMDAHVADVTEEFVAAAYRCASWLCGRRHREALTVRMENGNSFEVGHRQGACELARGVGDALAVEAHNGAISLDHMIAFAGRWRA